MAGKRKIFTDKETLISMYNKYNSAYIIADKFNVNVKTVYGLMKYYDIKQTTGSQGARKHNFNYSYFSSIDSPDKAYWLGFIMADGCVYKGSDGKSLRLQINLQADDYEHLCKFQKAIQSNYKIQIKEYKGCKVAILKINSTQMCNDLIKLGVTERKSIICKYPNTPYDKDFIRGYFDGDGCISKSNNGKWAFSIVGGQDMIESIDDIVPVKMHIYKVKHSSLVSLETSKHADISRIYEFLYSDKCTCLSRKFDKFKYFYNNYNMSPSGVIY